MKPQQVARINLGRLEGWALRLNAENATAQALFGVCHAPGDEGKVILCRTEDGPSDEELFRLLLGALTLWGREQGLCE